MDKLAFAFPVQPGASEWQGLMLAGTILANLSLSQLVELPYLVNYPFHMHSQYPAKRRVTEMNDQITGRYDTFFQGPGWREVPSFHEPLKSWLDEPVPRELSS